jgi:hypothetical protein
MRGPGAEFLLRAWELGLDQSPTSRALGLLAAASPENSVEEHALLPIGVRDGHLLGLRAELFGDAVAAVTDCPACGDTLDVQFDVRSLLSAPDLAADGAGGAVQVSIRGYDITFRVPTSADLLAVTAADEPAYDALLARCVLSVRELDAETPVAALPADVVATLYERMEAADPGARIELGLTCPSCGHPWGSLIDVASFLWTEVDAWARRMLRDVHTLARAYGWRESEILAMSHRRRQGYLELVRS